MTVQHCITSAVSQLYQTKTKIQKAESSAGSTNKSLLKRECFQSLYQIFTTVITHLCNKFKRALDISWLRKPPHNHWVDLWKLKETAQLNLTKTLYGRHTVYPGQHTCFPGYCTLLTEGNNQICSCRRLVNVNGACI